MFYKIFENSYGMYMFKVSSKTFFVNEIEKNKLLVKIIGKQDKAKSPLKTFDIFFVMDPYLVTSHHLCKAYKLLKF